MHFVLKNTSLKEKKILAKFDFTKKIDLPWGPVLRAIDVVEESNPELLCRLLPGLPAKTATNKCKQTIIKM